MGMKQLLKKATNILPDALFLRLEYFRRFGRFLNLREPKTFNEKLQWLKLYDRKPEYCTMVDKYDMKQYVTGIVGPGYVIPTLGVWDSFDEIDFDSLPDQFVLKCTHDSGGLVICKDKTKLDVEAARRAITDSLNVNYYWHSREWPYKNLKPRIIAEQYMVDESGTQLKDYKIHCFDGTPYCIQVDFDRFSGHKKNLYSPDWEIQEFSFNYPAHPEIKIERPDTLEQMLELAKVLSVGKPYLRVDFYSISHKPYIGELTFFPASGFGKFIPDRYDRIFGDQIKLPEKTTAKD